MAYEAERATAERLRNLAERGFAGLDDWRRWREEAEAFAVSVLPEDATLAAMAAQVESDATRAFANYEPSDEGDLFSGTRQLALRLMDEVKRVLDILGTRGNDAPFLTATELRQIEVVVAKTVEVIHTSRLDPETLATIQAAVDTLRAQTASPKPDRLIVGRALRGIATHAGALLIGVASNYLTDLLKVFHQVPWPGH